MVVENQANLDFRWVATMKEFEKLNEFPTSMAIAHQVMDMPCHQVDARDEATRPVTDVLELSVDLWMQTWDRRKVWPLRFDGLDTRLLVAANHDLRLTSSFGSEHLDFLVDYQDLDHLPIEFRIPSLEVVPNLVGANHMFGQDLRDSATRDLGQARMAGDLAMLADVAAQEVDRPQLVRISKVFGLLACKRHQPDPSLLRQLARSPRPCEIIERSNGANLESPINHSIHGASGLRRLPRNPRDGLAVSVREKDSSPLDARAGLGAGSRDTFKSSTRLRIQVQRGLGLRKRYGRLPPKLTAPAAGRTAHCS